MHKAWGAAKVCSTQTGTYICDSHNVVLWSTDAKNRKPPNKKVMQDFHFVVASMRATFPTYRSPTDWTTLMPFVKVARNEANWRTNRWQTKRQETAGVTKTALLLSNAMDWLQSKPTVPGVVWRNTNTAKWDLFMKFTSNCLYTLQPSGHYMYHQFNFQQFHLLPTQLYLCVSCGSENKRPLFPYTTLTDWFV